MKLFGFNIGADKKIEAPVIINNTPEDKPQSDLSSSFHFVSQNEYSPSISSRQVRNGMVLWGNNNLHPLQLVDLYNSSPIHASITLQKSIMVCGEGIQYKNFSGLTPEQQTELLRFDSFADGCDKSLFQVATELSLDYQIFGCMALEVIWDLTFTKIIKINRIPMVNTRIGEENLNSKIDTFFFNKDWTRPNINGTIQIPALNIENKTSTNQIIFIKNPSISGRDYGVPHYTSALKWINTDAAISSFHLSNVENGMNPSLKINFYKDPEDPILKSKVIREIENSFAGQRNAGRPMILFSDGKELATDITPIQVNNIDKQFTVIAQQVVEQIVRGHRAVSGILFGISTAGNKLSLAGEFESAFKIFERTVISQDRKVLEQVLNKILKINGIDAGLKFAPYQVFNSSLDQ